jgi:hypothetical protein
LRNLKNNEDLVQIGAQERTRTSTPLRELAPESSFGITAPNGTGWQRRAKWLCPLDFQLGK